MRTRFLLGPAGSGKTFRCLTEIREELKSAPEGLPLVMLAPKQATFQLERLLLAGPDLPGYSRLQILSFERLAEFVLAEFPPSTVTVAAHRPGPFPSKKTRRHSEGQREFPFWELAEESFSSSERAVAQRDLPIRATLESITAPQRILDEEGRVMVLRALLAQKQKELRIYRATARLPGFAQQLSLLLRELQRHQHSSEKLFALAAQIHSTPQLADKLHDLALLLRAYHDWLKEHRLQDVNSLLDLATEALRAPAPRRDGLVDNAPLSNAKTTRHGQPASYHSELRAADAVLCFGGLWLDGFAEMTPQELDFLARLTPLCARATLAFCLENKPAEDLSWLSTWSVVGQTFRKCYQRLAALPGSEVEVEILERKLDRGRFVDSPVLAHLEQNWPKPKPFECRRQDDSSGLQETLRVVLCPNPDAEVVLAAREILRHVRAGGRFRDCAVLVRTHVGYHDALRRVFQRYEIPFFLDRREPVAHHPLAELTRYALRTVALGWEHDDWFGALKTGLVPGDEDEFDALENQALALGWKAGVWKQPLRIPHDEHLEKRLERLREKIVPPFELLAKRLAPDNASVQAQPTGSQLAEGLRQCWDQLDVEETLEQWSASEPSHASFRTPHSKIHSTVWSQMQSWLDNVAMAFPDDRMPLHDWLPILEAGLAGLTVGVIPPALDHVLVGTIDRSRNPELELALVLGLNESVFPAVPQTTGLLTETDREQLEARRMVLGPSKLAQLGHERYYGYIACTRARRRLVLTCAQRDANDRALNPSPFLAHLKRLFPSLEAENCPEPEHWLASEHACELQAPLVRNYFEARLWFLSPRRRSGERTEERGGPSSPRPSPPSDGGEGVSSVPVAPGCEVPGSEPSIRSLSSLASLPAFASLRDQLRALASYAPSDSISPALAEQLFGPALRTSVSALEQFAACPFKFFVHFGLRAEERKYFEADAREQGSFQHRILAQFHEELQQEGKRWRDLTPQEARARVGRIARQTADEFREGLFDASDQNRFAARSLASALEDFIETIIGWMRDYGFDPRFVELAFGGEGDPLPAWEIDLGDGHVLVIRGKIDRVDLAENPGSGEALCSVIDYKSGRKKIDSLLLEHGIQIQLPAYLAALRHVADPYPLFGVRRLVPAGVFYASLRGSYKAGENRSAALNGARETRLLAYRHAGRFRFDALGQFDRQAPEANSGQFNYALTNEGKPNRRSADLLEPDEFNALLDHVEHLLREMGRRILTGDAKVDPYRKGTEVACDSCDSRAICRIDRWTHRFRLLKREPAASKKP